MPFGRVPNRTVGSAGRSVLAHPEFAVCDVAAKSGSDDQTANAPIIAAKQFRIPLIILAPTAMRE